MRFLIRWTVVCYFGSNLSPGFVLAMWTYYVITIPNTNISRDVMVPPNMVFVCRSDFVAAAPLLAVKTKGCERRETANIYSTLLLDSYGCFYWILYWVASEHSFLPTHSRAGAQCRKYRKIQFNWLNMYSNKRVLSKLLELEDWYLESTTCRYLRLLIASSELLVFASLATLR